MKKVACMLTLAVLTGTVLTGCASIVNDANQKVVISASNGQEIKGTIQDEKKVTVTENGKKVKKTERVSSASFSGKPADVMVARANVSKVIVVENDGCQKETPLKNSVSGMFFGNILIGGLLGSTTDATTGKMWKYDETVVIPCK